MQMGKCIILNMVLDMTIKCDIECVSTLTAGTKRLVYNRHGKPHRINGAAIVFEDTGAGYFQYGEQHRINGPAFVSGWYVEYYKRGVYYVPKI
jgi:hypothetical protein